VGISTTTGIDLRCCRCRSALISHLEQATEKDERGKEETWASFGRSLRSSASSSSSPGFSDRRHPSRLGLRHSLPHPFDLASRSRPWVSTCRVHSALCPGARVASASVIDPLPCQTATSRHCGCQFERCTHPARAHRSVVTILVPQPTHSAMHSVPIVPTCAARGSVIFAVPEAEPVRIRRSGPS
jgi:hypothetical protein